MKKEARRVIPAVLVYLQTKDQVLMIHRNAPGSETVDFHHGKWNGLGGKLELDESPLEAAIREVREESGIELGPECFQSLGVLQFPNFKPHKNEDWVVFVFRARISDSLSVEGSRAPSFLKECPEGSLHWILTTDILKLNLWPGDRFFIPYVLKGQPFMGTLWYQNGEVVRHWIQPMQAGPAKLF